MAPLRHADRCRADVCSQGKTGSYRRMAKVTRLTHLRHRMDHNLGAVQPVGSIPDYRRCRSHLCSGWSCHYHRGFTSASCSLRYERRPCVLMEASTMNRFSKLAVAALLGSTALGTAVRADEDNNGHSALKHVLLISVDGMHA